MNRPAKLAEIRANLSAAERILHHCGEILTRAGQPLSLGAGDVAGIPDGITGTPQPHPRERKALDQLRADAGIETDDSEATAAGMILDGLIDQETGEITDEAFDEEDDEEEKLEDIDFDDDEEDFREDDEEEGDHIPDSYHRDVDLAMERDLRMNRPQTSGGL